MNQTLTRTFGLALIVIAVALGIFGLPLAQQPPRFEASALVKVERDNVDLPELNQIAGLTAQAAAEADNTFFIQTEIALLQSEATLNRVITNLDLNHVWAKRLNDGQSLKISETLQILKGRLHAQPGPEVTLITIKAVSEIPTEAAEMANAAARAYCDYRADYRRRLTQSALDAVAGKFAEMQNKIVLAREKLQQAGQKLDPALLEQAAAGPPAAESETLRTLRARYSGIRPPLPGEINQCGPLPIESCRRG
ncbi:MAG: Wzz/FepE/Etk N-terminal domain-containing protein [Verrucomicrobiota bacterium]